MTDTELQQQALNKYNKISMGNGSDIRTMRLFNIQQLLSKTELSDADRHQLQHFISATRAEIENTAYVANTVVYPQSWCHNVTVLTQKNAKTAK